MILLRPDCLVFRTSDGQHVPCPAQTVVVELVGTGPGSPDAQVINHATAAVLHYFKEELGCTTVSVGQFSQALKRVLENLGFDVALADDPKRPAPPELDLRELAAEATGALELLFFPRLREELKRQLEASPPLVRCRGLRGCVKCLTGSKRWCDRCQQLNDQIVEFLRTCLSAERSSANCALVVR